MKKIKKVPVEIRFFEGNRPEWEDMEEGVIYVHKESTQSFHNCLCGCKEPVVMALDFINIDGEEIKGIWPPGNWNLTIKDGKATFSPSVGNYEFPCKSHYIITKGIANFV